MLAQRVKVWELHLNSTEKTSRVLLWSEILVTLLIRANFSYYFDRACARNKLDTDG